MSLVDGSLAVVAAHQDDEILGCGGLMQHALRGGWPVTVLSLCQKVRNHKVDAQLVLDYETSLRDALGVLASDTDMEINVVFCAFETEILYSSWRDVMVFLADTVKELAPDIVAIPWRHDLHQDHRAASEAARFMARGLHIPPTTVIEYEAPGASDQQFDMAFCPNVFLPISKDTLLYKQMAMSKIVGELRAWPHPRSTEGIEAQAKLRGMQIGHALAEGFRLYRTVLAGRM